MALRKAKRLILDGDPDREEKLAKRKIEEEENKIKRLEAEKRHKERMERLTGKKITQETMVEEKVEMQEDQEKAEIGNEDLNQQEENLAEAVEAEQEKAAAVDQEDGTEGVQSEEAVKLEEVEETTVEKDQKYQNEIQAAKEEIEEVVNQENLEEEIPILDISDAVEPKSRPTNRGRSNKGSSAAIKVINTKRSGRRIVFKGWLVKYLDSTEVEIAFTKDALIIAPSGTGISTSTYELRENKKNFNLYDSSLVKEITEFFSLDFQSRTTMGLATKQAQSQEGTRIVQATKED